MGLLDAFRRGGGLRPSVDTSQAVAYAGKLAAARRLTEASAEEQASAGLDALTDAERQTFGELNDAYTARFGFPFIIAVRDHGKAAILEAFAARLANEPATEFATACKQVERIAELRLQAVLPG